MYAVIRKGSKQEEKYKAGSKSISPSFSSKKRAIEALKKSNRPHLLKVVEF